MNLSPETLARIAKLADDIGCSQEKTVDAAIRNLDRQVMLEELGYAASFVPPISRSETPDGSITAQETVKEWLSRG
jgi:hypothetical protein